MSSILTNNSAMVALQTLKNINQNLGKTQGEIATGKSVATAKDNSAIWAISKVMESDVSGFNTIKDSLALGESTVAVASAGAASIVETLKEMKDLAISGKGENVDHAKIQASLAEKKAQIASVVGASQFNGLNLLATGTTLTVVSSMDRAAGGAVTPGQITVATVDFQATVSGATVTGVTDAATAETARGEIEALLKIAIDGTAKLGAAQSRISDQGDFVGKLVDAMKSGIGSLVDADMEEASARLQALQVQQQLATQSLSIANQAPQSILSLFR